MHESGSNAHQQTFNIIILLWFLCSSAYLWSLVISPNHWKHISVLIILKHTINSLAVFYTEELPWLPQSLHMIVANTFLTLVHFGFLGSHCSLFQVCSNELSCRGEVRVISRQHLGIKALDNIIPDLVKLSPWASMGKHCDGWNLSL